MNETPETILGFPLNRIVAFVGPYISTAAGGVTTWLFVHLHFLALFHVGQSSVAKAIAQTAVFGVTAALVWAGHQKWLTGHQQWEQSVHAAQIAAMPPDQGDAGKP